MSQTGKPHVLVITHIPAEGEWEAETEYEVEHHPDCPTETYALDPDGIVLVDYTCDIGYEILNVGLDGLCWDPGLVPGWVKPEGVPAWSHHDDWKGLPEGRYIIQAWHSYSSYFNEYDSGLDLLGREDDVIAA